MGQTTFVDHKTIPWMIAPSKLASHILGFTPQYFFTSHHQQQWWSLYHDIGDHGG